MLRRILSVVRNLVMLVLFAMAISAPLAADPNSRGAALRVFLAELVAATDLTRFSGLNAYELAGEVPKPPESEMRARQALRIRALFVENAPLLQAMLDAKTGTAILEEARLSELKTGFEALQRILRENVFGVIPSSQLTAFSLGTVAARQRILDQVPDQTWNDVVDAVQKQLEGLDFSKFEAIQRLSSIELEIPNAEMKKLAQTALGSYFDARMPYEQKRQILEAVLRLAPDQQATRLVGTVFANTKILFQKALQFFADRSTNEEFKKAADSVKSELPGLKDADYLHGMSEVVGPEEFRKFSAIKQVAAGTTAVGAIFKHSEHSQLFTKLLRPGIHRDLESDYQRFRTLMGNDPGAIEMVDSIAEGVRLELSIRRETFNFVVAEAIFNSSDGVAPRVRIPKVFREIAPANDRLIVLEIAPGKPVARIDMAALSNRDLAQIARGYEQMLEIWFSNTYGLEKADDLLSPGEIDTIQRASTEYLGRKLSKKEVEGMSHLFHGDLHGGNVFMNPLDFARGGVPGGYWIDWGNAHFLTRQQRAGQLKSVLGSALRDLDMIQDGLEAVVRFKAPSRALFRKEMMKYFAGAGATAPPDQVLNRAISVALQSGVGLPEAIVNAGRGQGMLINQLNTVRTELARRRVLGRYGLRPPAKVLIETIQTHLQRDLPTQVFSAGARRDAAISLATVWEVATTYLGRFARQVCPTWMLPDEKSVLDSKEWVKPVR